MRLKTILVLSCTLAVGSLAHAQPAKKPAKAPASGKFVAKMQCPALQPAKSYDLADKPGHSLMIGTLHCEYLQGALGGDKISAEDDTLTSDVIGNLAHDHGYGALTTVGGAKAFVRFDGTTSLKSNGPTSAKGTWSFTGGTGTAMGVTGKGTYTVAFKADGTSTVDITGTYAMSAARKK